jgi:hypothetical protein
MRGSSAAAGGGSAPDPFLHLDVHDLIVSTVAAHPEIDLVFLGRPYINVPLLSRADLLPGDRDLIRTAVQQSNESGVPVWDAVMLQLTRSDQITSTLLNQAMVHHGIAETQFSVRADAFPGKLLELLPARPPDRILAMCSKVQLKNGATKHIPMIDFRCPVGAHSLQLVAEMAKRLDAGRGFIVETDLSYHFYGAALLTESEWSQFLGRALQFSPIVDRAWIAHQLIDLCCTLRIAPRLPEGKKLRVVAVVEERSAE